MNHQSTRHDPELNLPLASGVAFQAAGFEAIANGDPIIESVDGELCEVLADGTRKVIRHIKPTTPYPSGTKIDLP